MEQFDLIIRGADVVRPTVEETRPLDIGISQGRIVAVGTLPTSSAAEVFDAHGLLAFLGAVDGHQHWGIYNPLATDTASESQAAAQGGVTTALTYMPDRSVPPQRHRAIR